MKYLIYHLQSEAGKTNYEIPGLSEFLLLARSVVGSGCHISLTHSLSMKKTFHRPRAVDGQNADPGQTGGSGRDGARGTDGIDGTMSK